MSLATMPEQIPIVDYLVLGAEPHLRAQVCAACGALYFDRRSACARCEGRQFEWRSLADTGVVRSFTIVHRSPARVRTPYASALVELDDGGLVKANLINVDPTPDQISLGMRVQLTTFVAGTDDEGSEAIGFAYEPASSEVR